MVGRVEKELAELEARSLLREFTPAGLRESGTIVFRGKKLVDFTNYDSLGLSQNPKLKLVAQKAIEQFGLASCSSRLSTGSSAPLLSAETRLAAFFGAESALLFSSRNQAVLSLLTAVMREGDVIFVDELSQGPAADAAFLVGAEAVSFDLENPTALEKKFDSKNSARNELIYFDSVAAATGRVADVSELFKIASNINALTVIDESQSVSVSGLRGAGILEPTFPEVKNKILARLVDLSSGFGVQGAAVLADAALVRLLAARSRTLTAEIAPPAYAAALLEAAISEVEFAQVSRTKILELVQIASEGLAGMGLKVSAPGQLSFVCIEFKSFALAQEFQQALISKGFLTEALRIGRLRSERSSVKISITVNNSTEQIKDLLSACTLIASKLA